MVRILIVDDKVGDLDAMQLGAQEAIDALGGGQIDRAQDVATAMSLLDTHQFDVVVADLQLTQQQRNEGWEVLQYARKRNASTKVIIVTAYPEPEKEARSVALGAFSYMDKFVETNLISGIKKALEMKAHLLSPAFEHLGNIFVDCRPYLSWMFVYKGFPMIKKYLFELFAPDDLHTSKAGG